MGDVVTALDGGVLTVTIDRPAKRNALNVDVNRGLLGALDAARSDDVAVVVLTGAGEQAFCAGADLGGGAGGVQTPPNTGGAGGVQTPLNTGGAGGVQPPKAGLREHAGAVGQHRDRALFAEVLAGLRSLPKPVVGRVNGHALAGGFGLALSCDLVIAADNATFGTTEVKVGLWPYMITTVIADHLGPKQALELMLTGRRLSAEEALAWRLVNRVVPADALDAAVAETVQALLAVSRVTLSLGKEAYAAAADMRREDALPYLAAMLSLHLQTEDAVEGVTAFLQKRPPQWKGR